MKRHYIPVTADVPGVSEGTRSFLRRVIRTALAEQGVDFPCEVDVLVTGDAGIHAINLGDAWGGIPYGRAEFSGV